VLGMTTELWTLYGSRDEVTTETIAFHKLMKLFDHDGQKKFLTAEMPLVYYLLNYVPS
jgi:hypothetical protein